MANLDEIPRGQLSTIILTCLSEQDKYGYEIIDEVLKKTNGRMSIKQPSLYSSLKRMEEQSLISSYWRESEIGGRRHYYHLTDLGKKHLEKWQDSLPDNFLSNNDNSLQEQTKVLQQENLFSLTSSNEDTVKLPSKIEDKPVDNSYVQYDIFSNSVIITPPAQEEIKQDAIKQPEDSSILNNASIEKNSINEEQLIFKDFDFVKKSNKSFADKVKTINTIEEKKFIEVKQEIPFSEEINNEIIVPQSNFEQPLPNHLDDDNSIINDQDISENYATQLDDSHLINNNTINGNNSYESYFNTQDNCTESFRENSINFNEQSSDLIDRIFISNISESEIKINNESKLLEIVDEELSTPVNNNIDFEKIQGYIPRPKQEEQEIKQEEKKEEEFKDDGVLITDRLNPEDMPKPYKWDSRRFEVYISDNSITPYLEKKDNTNYEDRVKELYEKSKTSADNQKIEIVDNVIKLSSYQELQEFYANQNIKFKPYQKKLKKTERDYDMIKINKFNMLTSLLLFIVISLLSTTLGVILSYAESAYLNSPITFAFYPIILLIFFISKYLIYLKSPQKRIAHDINKYKLNFGFATTSILIIPIILAINFIAGFTFNLTDMIKHSITISIPCLFAITYFIYHIIQKITLKFKGIY